MPINEKKCNTSILTLATSQGYSIVDFALAQADSIYHHGLESSAGAYDLKGKCAISSTVT
jgi:hypothetical protein